MSRAEGYAGAQRASDHADRVEPLWSKIATVRFLEFLVTLHRGAIFTMEDFRNWVMYRSLSDPPDNRAFGNLSRMAVRKKLILWTGEYRRSKNPQTHGRDVKLWMVT